MLSKYSKGFALLFGFLCSKNASAEFNYQNYKPILTGLYDSNLSSINSAYIINFTSPTSFTYLQNPAANGLYLTRILNSSVDTTTINGYFYGLTSAEDGTAINNTGTLGNINADFIGNTTTLATTGKIIYNSGTIGDINGDFIGNTFNHSTVYNIGTINNITGNFIGNHSISNTKGYAGAIYSYSPTLNTQINNIKGNFIGNYLVWGQFQGAGAIYIGNDSLTNISGNFIGNYTKTSTGITSDGRSYTGSSSGAITGIKIVMLADNANYEMTGNHVLYPPTTGLPYNKFYNAIFQPSSTDTNIFRVLNAGKWTINDNYMAGIFSGVNGRLNFQYSSGNSINIEGDGTGTVAFNSEIVNIKNVNVTDSTLKFGAYNHNDDLGYNNDSRGMFISGIQWLLKPTTPDYYTNLSLTNAKFDIANGYMETVKVLSYTSNNNSYLALDLDIDNKTSDVISVNGNVNGTTNVIVYSNSTANLADTDMVLFANSTNDSIGNTDSFNVYRVYGSPYIYEKIYEQVDTTTKNWYLTHALNTPVTVVPEIPAYIAIPNASVEQTRNLTLGARRNTLKGKHTYNTWASPVYINSKNTSQIDLKSNVTGAEAGFDMNTKIGRFGIFGSFRDGKHNLNGRGNISSLSGSNINIQSIGGGIYHRFDKKKFTLFSSIYGSHLDTNIETYDGLNTTQNGLQIGLAFDSSYNFKLSKKWAMYPGVGIQYDIFDLNDINDQYGKTASYENFGYGEIEIGSSFEYKLLRNTGVYVKPLFVYGIANNEQSEITGSGKFDTINNKTMGRLEIGSRTMLNKNISGYIYGRYTYGSDYSAISTGVGVNYKF